MRFVIACSVAMSLLITGCLGQQSADKQPQAPPSTQERQKKQTGSQKSSETSKPEEATAKSTEPKPSQPEAKPGEDAKQEHFDMTEVPPVVTHHQITVNGKLLKY